MPPKELPPAHHEGWMESDQETVICSVPIHWLTKVVNYVAFLLPTYLPSSVFFFQIPQVGALARILSIN
jgi:hypothetical protein